MITANKMPIHNVIESMKTFSVPSCIMTAILCLSGCNQIQPAAPVFQASADSIPQDSSSPAPSVSARYYYLESLVLHQQDQLEPAANSLEKAISEDPASAFLQRDLIRLYLEMGQEEKALALAEALAEKDPDDVDNLLMLVRMKKNTGSQKQMLSLLGRILELDPENKETYLRLGKIFMENQQFSRALDLFSRMAARLPQYYVAHFYLGEAHLLSGNYTAAEQAFLKTIDLEPDLVEPRFKRIEILRRQADDTSYEKMLEIYEEILEIEPENDRALLETALIYHKTGQTDKAKNLFDELGKQASTSSRMAMVAVDTYIAPKRYDDAVIVFSNLLKSDPDNENLHFFLGMAHESADNPEAAIQHYLKVSSAHPQYKKTLLNIGFLYRKTGKEKKAVAFLEDHHQKNPKDIDIISYLSAFYEKDGHLEKAMDLLAKGLADAPENTSLLFRLGAIQDKAGQKQACIATMKKILRIDPDDASALNYLGYTYADLGIHLDQALALIKKALEIKPDDGYITDSLGWVYFKKQEYEKAVFYLEKAASLTEYESIIASHLADAYVKTGRLSKALAVYHRAIVNAKEEDADLVLELKAKIKELEQQLPLPDTRKEQQPAQ